MKRVSRILFIMIALVFSVMPIAACGEENNGNPDIPRYSDPNYFQRQLITFASWDLGTEQANGLNRRMIIEFERAYSQYRVDIIPTGAGVDYTPSLKNLAAQEKLPDVFMIDSLPAALTNDWVADLTAIAAADEDWNDVPVPVEKATKFNDRVFAVPAGMHMAGFFVNDTVFDEANRNPLATNPAYTAFYNAVQALTKAGQVAGMNLEQSLLGWYAASQKSDFGYYTWDGAKYNLDSAEFAEGLSEMKKIRAASISYDSWSEEQKKASKAAGSYDLFRKKGMAAFYAYTYERNGLIYGDAGGTEVLFQGELRFIGTPGGRNVIIPDLYGIAANTKDAQAAYTLAKWLSFSPAGINKRIDIDADRKFISLPLTKNQEVVNKYFENEPVKGMKEVFLTIDNGIVEPLKYLPGYESSRSIMATGLTYDYVEKGAAATRTLATIDQVYDDIWKNSASIKWADIKDGINTKANNEYAKFTRSLNSKYPKL